MSVAVQAFTGLKMSDSWPTTNQISSQSSVIGESPPSCIAGLSRSFAPERSLRSVSFLYGARPRVALDGSLTRRERQTEHDRNAPARTDSAGGPTGLRVRIEGARPGSVTGPPPSWLCGTGCCTNSASGVPRGAQLVAVDADAPFDCDRVYERLLGG